MHAHACTHAHTHRTRENYVSFWAHEQKRRECRQTDDYLHDKDLKYSPFKRFPLKLVHHFPRRRRGPGRAGFDIRAIFQKVSETPALDSTSARTAGGERRSRIAVSPALSRSNALQKHVSRMRQQGPHGAALTR